MKTKIAKCCKCGKNLQYLVPANATEIICFACDQKAQASIEHQQDMEDIYGPLGQGR